MDKFGKRHGMTGNARRPTRLFCHELPSKPQPELGTILVTGASGYIGGRLVPELAARGYSVRVMVRAKSPEQRALWPTAEIAVGDALEIDTLGECLEGIHTAYYLIHSLHLGPKEFAAADIRAAANFRQAAEDAGVRRIIYLGGLGDATTPLSDHLRSRMEVARELRRGAVSTTVLRAATIIGSGSASYEIIKHVAESWPILLVPDWARNRCQPIAARDVVKYLVGVLEVPETAGKSFDIGGSTILTYQMMLKCTARMFGRRALFLPSPFSSVRFYAYITSLCTPVPAPITRCLFDGLRNEVVCQNESIRDFVPIEPIGYQEAVAHAMMSEEQDRVFTRWSDAYPPSHELAPKLHELAKPPAFTSAHSLTTTKNPAQLFTSFCRIGGKEGWFWNNWMWRLRGMVDRALLGVGSSRGRKSYTNLNINDVIDFWRVEDLQHDRRLLLRAEMKLPGLAWLEFNIKDDTEKSRLSVIAYYDTTTILGQIYWYMFLPFHYLIFTRLIQQIEARS